MERATALLVLQPPGADFFIGLDSGGKPPHSQRPFPGMRGTDMAPNATCGFTFQGGPNGVTMGETSTVRDMTRARREAATSNGYAPMNALSRLIQRRKVELDLTWAEIAQRGGFSSHTVVHALATKAEHRQVPRPETLERLAKALELPLDVVKAAAAEAAGYQLNEISVPLPDAEPVKIFAAALGDLTQEQKHHLARRAQLMAEELRAGGEAATNGD
jgi:transcriptional regulator with XRE-family HTH domain